MSKDVILQNALGELFPDHSTKECLSPPEHRERFVILEAELESGKWLAVIGERVEEEQNAFYISNPSAKAIYLLALDGCFFTDTDMKRCDCMLFDDLVVCFVELKLDVTSQRQRTDKLREARRQLGSTIQYFKEHIETLTENLFGFELEAYVVMRTRIYPRQRAGKEKRRVGFLEKYGTKLFEENEKTF